MITTFSLLAHWMPRRFKEILSRVTTALGVEHYITFPQNGYALRLCPTTNHRWLQALDTPRPIEHFLRRYIKAGDTVIDAGANVGIFSMVAQLMAGPTGQVYAIEPHPTAFAFLLRHIKDNKVTNVKTFNVALGSAEGVVHFTDKRSDLDLNHVQVNGQGGIQVPVCRLDVLFDSVSRVNLLKIDVEGYEKMVLEGAQDLLHRIDCILIEVEEDKCLMFGHSPTELLQIVRSAGFKIVRIVGNTASEAPTSYSPRNSEDLVAVKCLDSFLKRTDYLLGEIPLDLPSFRTRT